LAKVKKGKRINKYSWVRLYLMVTLFPCERSL
jgi:hypothetical protein